MNTTAICYHRNGDWIEGVSFPCPRDSRLTLEEIPRLDKELIIKILTFIQQQ